MKMFYCPKCDKLEINFKFKNLNEERELHTFSNIRDGWGMPINHIICRNCGNLLAGVMTLRKNDKDEIEYLQMEWDRTRAKCKKKAKKKMKKNGGFYPYEYEMKERKKLIKKMEDSNLFSRTELCLEDFRPICLIIARLIAALIVAILSIDAIKLYLKPETMEKMTRVYELAMSV